MRKKLRNKVRERLDIGGFRKLGSELDSAKRDDVDAEGVLRRVKRWSIGFACVGVLSLGGALIANSAISDSSSNDSSGGVSGDVAVSYGDGFIRPTQQGTASTETSVTPAPEITPVEVDSESNDLLAGATYIDGTPFTSERFEGGRRRPVSEVEVRLSNLLSNKYQDGYRLYPIVGFSASDESYYMLDTTHKIVFKAKEWGSGVEDNKYAYLYGKDMGMQAWLDVYKPRLMQGSDGAMLVENNVTSPIGFIRSTPTDLVGTASVANDINSLQIAYPSDIIVVMQDGTQDADELSVTAKLVGAIMQDKHSNFAKPFKITVIYVTGSQTDIFNSISDSTYNNYKSHFNVVEERSAEVQQDGRIISK